jgi:hypothetical protein
MKKTTFLTAVIFCCMMTLLKAQTFTTGFDTPAERSAWTEYRLDGTASSHWSYGTFYNVSPSYSAGHDYPMGGDTVQDWLVSPKLIFTGNSGSVSLYSRISAMSSPPDVYYGIWLSFGAKNPASGDYTELADLTSFPALQGTWADTAINASFTGDTGYVALRYNANNYAWLMLWIDNIAVDSAILAPVAGIDLADDENFQIYPNPTTGIVNIKGSRAGKIEVIDIYGRSIQPSFYTGNSATLDLCGYSDGIYYLRITNKDTVWTRKIILQ